MLDIDVTARFGTFDLKAALTLPSGVTALVGPSGAGKSSLLRLLAGLSVPETGRIKLGDKPLCDMEAKLSIAPERRQIGMVFQRPALMPHMSVRQNILIGARGHALSGDLLERTGCARLIGKPIAALSGGEQQRVMLARALVGKPALLLLDEPLSALDPASRDELLGLFAELFPTLDIPVIHVTHAMEEAGRVARHFVLMRAGRIVVAGDAPTVLSQYGNAGEGGIAAILHGAVRDIADDGLAAITVGNQQVEVMGEGLAPGARVSLRVWARDVVLARSVIDNISARNALAGEIAQINTLPGGQVEVRIAVEGQYLLAIVMARTVAEMGLAAGQKVTAIFKSASVERMA